MQDKKGLSFGHGVEAATKFVSGMGTGTGAGTKFVLDVHSISNQALPTNKFRARARARARNKLLNTPSCPFSPPSPHYPPIPTSFLQKPI